MVQVLSKKGFEVSTHCNGWDYDSVQKTCVERIRINPPTAVGGISDFLCKACSRDNPNSVIVGFRTVDPLQFLESTIIQRAGNHMNQMNSVLVTQPPQDFIKCSQLWLVRHGETEWSISGQHTGRTDIPLTEKGEHHAIQIGRYLKHRSFAVVLTSPLLRARETCRLAGFAEKAEVDPNLREWDYGDYEGRTTQEILKVRPGWSLWKDGVPGGESIEQVAARAQAVIDHVAGSPGDVLLFAHGHLLRVLSCCWLGLPPEDGRLFALATGAVVTLGYEHEIRVITRLNAGVEDS